MNLYKVETNHGYFFALGESLIDAITKAQNWINDNEIKVFIMSISTMAKNVCETKELLGSLIS